MARLARIVIPNVPHHVTQRGNGRQQTFFSAADYALYRDLLGSACRAAKVQAWAWCLMPNHVHLILVPQDRDGLRLALARVHRAYAGAVHARQKRTGHFWQGRFVAVAMDEAHLAAALDLRFPDLTGLLAAADDSETQDALRRAETIGRPLGTPAFLEGIEKMLGRQVTPRKPGPKPGRKTGDVS